MDGLFTRDSSKDVKARMDVSIWVIKLTFNIKPLFIQKKRQNVAQNGLFAYRRLTMGDAQE